MYLKCRNYEDGQFLLMLLEEKFGGKIIANRWVLPTKVLVEMVENNDHVSNMPKCEAALRVTDNDFNPDFFSSVTKFIKENRQSVMYEQ